MLRITAGDQRGRKLPVPKVKATRPLSERARMAVLDHLQAWVPTALVWDICAGSGILGFECLSRGAVAVVAVERHSAAASHLREAAEQLGFTDRLEVRQEDARAFLQTDPVAPDLVFYDPPYAAFRGSGRPEAWSLFRDLCARLQPGGVAVVHTPRGLLSDGEMAQLTGLERRDFSAASLYWWHCPEEDQSAKEAEEETEA